MAIAKREQQVVLRKAAKALDTKNTEIAILRLEKRALEQEIEDLRPKKKKKVAPEIGEAFCPDCPSICHTTAVRSNTGQ